MEFFLFNLIGVLFSIMFLTMFERKFLSYIQIRKGPNKVGILGIFQPLSDAMKLFSKEQEKLKNINKFFYFLAPLMMLIMSFFCWMLNPVIFMNLNFEMGFLLFICVTSMSIYYLLMSGWFSYSKYSIIGMYRGIVQSISYEIILFLIFLNYSFLLYNFNFFKLFNLMFLNNMLMFWFLLIFFMVFFLSFISELNRSPFDLIEGESELVSGFNTEFMSMLFSMIFMSEYSMIMLNMLLLMIFYFLNLFFFMNFLFLILSVIWIRGTFPRIRYDKLMMIFWKVFLCFIMFMYFFFMQFLF